MTQTQGTTFDVPAGTPLSGTARCAPGDVLIGGGYESTLFGECSPSEQGISGSGDWFVKVTCGAGSGAPGVTVFAHCLSVGG